MNSLLLSRAGTGLASLLMGLLSTEQERRVAGLGFFRKLRILTAEFLQSFNTKANCNESNSFSSESPLKKGNGKKTTNHAEPQRH